jgi:hypothetical protein
VAYAGPATLSLRKDLGAKSTIIGSAKHGDRLEVLDTRRRFVKVRTATGIEGWTDLVNLLSEAFTGFRDRLRTAEYPRGALPAIAQLLSDRGRRDGGRDRAPRDFSHTSRVGDPQTHPGAAHHGA